MLAFTQFLHDLVHRGIERFGRYYSSYRGFVYSREDPDGYGRLLLIIPHITGITYLNYWAWHKGGFSGPGYGMQVIPQKGDMVWVSFEFGDPNRPIWEYGHFGKDKTANKKEKPGSLSDPDIYWFRTPKGVGVEINDKTQEIKVYGKGLTIISTDVSIQVGKNRLDINDSGVNIDVPKGNRVYVNGSNAVLYSKVPYATEITDVSEIGISQTVMVGGDSK